VRRFFSAKKAVVVKNSAPWRLTYANPPVFATGETGSLVAGGKPARLLIAEDEHLVAIEIENTLADAGFQVVGVAGTAEEAIKLALSEKPDLAVMDIRLAGARDGVDAALELFNLTGMRCIFATAHHDAGTRLRAQPARPLAWLSKPYEPAALVEAVRGALLVLDKH
jgi:two-component system, response regulator PdtaR